MAWDSQEKFTIEFSVATLVINSACALAAKQTRRRGVITQEKSIFHVEMHIQSKDGNEAEPSADCGAAK